MYSLLKISAGILLCLPFTGCAGPSYYDPCTGMVCGGPMYGPTNMIDDIKCSLSKHRASRMRKHCCGNCCTNSCINTIPGVLASGTFSTDWNEGPVESFTPESYSPETYAPETYAPNSSCPHCGPENSTYSDGPVTSPGTTYSPRTSPRTVPTPKSVPGPPATVVPQKISPVPDRGPNGVLNKPAPAPAAEEPMSRSSSVPPALLHAPSSIPQAVSQKNNTRRVQWVPARIH